LGNIAIIATLDTKGGEVQFVKERIERRGHQPLVIDAGILGEPSLKAECTREQVAEAGGKTLKELVEAAKRGVDRAAATNVMIEGAKKTVRDLYAQGKLDGLISLGGSTGTSIGLAAMKTLPIGIPKLMLTTVMGGQPVGNKDILMMPLTGNLEERKRTLSVAAGAVVGMVEVEVPKQVRPLPLVGITSLGVTTPAVKRSISLLEKKGYDPISFHARTMILDELIEEQRVKGVLDMTIYEVFLLGEKRLESAGIRGLPQVIVPGGVDMLIFPGTKEAVAARFKGRAIHVHGPNMILVRTTREEVEKAAKAIVGRVNRAIGPVTIMIPLKGFSAVDKEGQNFYDPETDKIFASVVEANTKENVEVIEVNAHINDEKFAEEVVDTFDKMYKAVNLKR